jgi:hypothetical protein
VCIDQLLFAHNRATTRAPFYRTAVSIFLSFTLNLFSLNIRERSIDSFVTYIDGGAKICAKLKGKKKV